MVKNTKDKTDWAEVGKKELAVFINDQALLRFKDFNATSEVFVVGGNYRLSVVDFKLKRHNHKVVARVSRNFMSIRNGTVYEPELKKLAKKLKLPYRYLAKDAHFDGDGTVSCMGTLKRVLGVL